MNNLMSSIERLELAGRQDKLATEKLKVACKKLADYICDDVVGFCCDIPKADEFESYRIQQAENGAEYLAIKCVADAGATYEAFFKTSPNWGREECLAFSSDVYSGLLDHIADWLEARTEEAHSALSTLWTE